MRTKKLSVIFVMFLLLLTVSCSKKEQQTTGELVQQEVITEDIDSNQTDNTNDANPTEELTNASQNDTVTQGLLYLKSELPERHKNLFSKISEEEFNSRIDELIENQDQLNDYEICVSLKQIVASVGDAHTNVYFGDGYHYPLWFTMIDGNVYIINADQSLEEMMFSKVKYIDGVDINTITEQLTTLIPHANDSWVLARLPEMLSCPIYLYGLDLIKDEMKATFTVEQGGVEKDYLVTALSYEESANYVSKKTNDVLLGTYDENYEIHI